MVSFPYLKAPLLLSPSTAFAGLDLTVYKLFYSSWSLTVPVAPNTVQPFIWHQSCLGVIGSDFSRPVSPFLMKRGDLSWMRWLFWMLLTVVHSQIWSLYNTLSLFPHKVDFHIKCMDFPLKLPQSMGYKGFMYGFFSKICMEYGV